MGIDVCIRSEHGHFILARYVTWGKFLLVVLEWIHKLNFGSIYFELNSKRVFDSFYSTKIHMSAYEDILCNSISFIFYRNFWVEFATRQMNAYVNLLVKWVGFLVSFEIFVDISHYIIQIIINEILNFSYKQKNYSFNSMIIEQFDHFIY